MIFNCSRVISVRIDNHRAILISTKRCFARETNRHSIDYNVRGFLIALMMTALARAQTN